MAPLARRGVMQLRRLTNLTDVVYGLVIWWLFLFIPRPGEEGWGWRDAGTFVSENLPVLILIVIGVTFTIIYWSQNNLLTSSLSRTDGRHTTLSIVQIFLLLLFLFSLRIGIELGGSLETRLFESVAAALVGYAGSWGWAYAIKKRRLLREDVTDAEAAGIADRILAEPIAATLTIPAAFIDPLVWELTWLTYPLIVKLLSRRRPRRQDDGGGSAA
jgi:uncharacterized membrane protein